MSAFLSSADCLNALATYWERKAKAPGGYTTPADSLARAVRRSNHKNGARENPAVIDAQADALISKLPPFAAMFQILLLENQRSLEARYPSDTDYRAAGPDYKPQRLQIVDYWLAARQTGQLVGLLRGYRYQACEHDGWETSVASQLCQEIELQLLKDLESRDCGDNGNWASWEAPADPRQIAMEAALRLEAYGGPPAA